jgi:hypothetical protein
MEDKFGISQMCRNFLKQRMEKLFPKKCLLKYRYDQILDLNIDSPYDEDCSLKKHIALNEVEVCWNYTDVSLANTHTQKYIKIYNPEKYKT